MTGHRASAAPIGALLANAELPGRYWLPVRDGDPRARALYHRHYSRRHYADGRRPLLFVGPGEKTVLLTPDARALFVWRRFIDRSGQTGVNCAIFRNEGPTRSSDLIREAMRFAWARWPGQRLYTFVNPGRIRSTNPGFCFLAAGWRRVGRTKGGLVILVILAIEAPAPIPPQKESQP